VQARTPGPSPFRITARLIAPSERRRDPRLIVVDWLYDLRGDLLTMDVPIVLRDFSLGGFAFESAIQVPDGALHAFRFTAEDGSSFIVNAECVHSRRANQPGPARYLTGLRFVRSTGDGNDPVRAVMDKIIRALSF